MSLRPIKLWEAERSTSGSPVRLAFAGDVCLARGFERRFSEASVEEVVDAELLAFLRDADLTVANIETVLSDRLDTFRIPGAGLRAGSSMARTVRDLGIDLAGLANNHIRDNLCAGVTDTLDHLHACGVMTVGAGKNSTEAGKPWIGECQGRRIGVLAVAEREMNIAGEDRAGSALFDPATLPDEIRSLRPKVDLLVVFVHAGHEFFLSPSPRFYNACRAAAGAGADAVIGHHPHVMNGFEVINGCPIFYSLGNFCFDSDYVCAYPHWEKGGIVKMAWDDGGLYKIELAPFEIKRAESIRPVSDMAGFATWFLSLNEPLQSSETVVSAWKKNAWQRYETELKQVFQKNAAALVSEDPALAALRWVTTFSCPTTQELYTEIFSQIAGGSGLIPY